MMSAPWPISFAAHAFAIAGLLPWVSQVTIFSCRPLTPPLPFHCFTRTCAAARAGLSNGDIAPFESKAQPITIGLLAADAVPATTATAMAATARSAVSAPFFLRVITPSWVRLTV